MFKAISHCRRANLFCGIVLCLVVPVTKGFTQTAEASPAARALYHGEYVEARELATRHLRNSPTDVSVRIILARADLAMGKYGEALGELKKVLATDPHNNDALYYLSFAARGLSQQEYATLYRL